jgi:hypothetical protein
MEAYKDKADFEVHWLPYQLNPTAAKEGVNKLEYYREKVSCVYWVLATCMHADT